MTIRCTLTTDSKAFDAHAVEDRVAQDAGIVDHAVELAGTVDRHFDGRSCWRDRLRDRLEICNRGAAALLDFLLTTSSKGGYVALDPELPRPWPDR